MGTASTSKTCLNPYRARYAVISRFQTAACVQGARDDDRAGYAAQGCDEALRGCRELDGADM